MKNITMFKGNVKNGFTKFQVYTHNYKKTKDGKTKTMYVIMLDFAHTKVAKKASNGKTVWDFSEENTNTIRLSISSSDITDLANLLAFLKHEKQTFSTVHASNSWAWNKSVTWFTGEQNVKAFVPWKWEVEGKEKTKTLQISLNKEKISFTLSAPEAKLIATWIEKHFI